jgi:hypothetical protein
MMSQRFFRVQLLCLVLAGLACSMLQPGAPPTPTPTVAPSTGSLFDLSLLFIDPSIDPSGLPITEGKGRTEDGFMIIPVTVQNDTGAPVRSVFVKAELLDANGTVIHVDAFSLDSFRLQPGEIGYGEYLRDVTKINGQPSSWRLSIAAAQTAQPQYHAVAENVTVTDEGGGFAEVEGTIRNDGSDTCVSPTAILAVYENGSVLYRINSWPLTSDLPAGESATFNTSSIIIPPGQVRVDVSASCDFVEGE